MIAALFVQSKGVYSNLTEVDAWPIERDAMKYKGPYPVIAHPPCARWCRLAAMVEARYPQYKKHEDGGTFTFALKACRDFGGVLEHPAWSAAWPTFGLPTPPASGGWLRTFCGGWVTHVEQIRYGHRAKKATWLYYFGDAIPPNLLWGTSPDCIPTATVSWCGNRTSKALDRPRLNSKDASATPVKFRDTLISIAKSSRKEVQLMGKTERSATPIEFRDVLIKIAKGAKND